MKRKRDEERNKTLEKEKISASKKRKVDDSKEKTEEIEAPASQEQMKTLPTEIDNYELKVPQRITPSIPQAIPQAVAIISPPPQTIWWVNRPQAARQGRTARDEMNISRLRVNTSYTGPLRDRVPGEYEEPRDDDNEDDPYAHIPSTPMV